MTRMTNRTLLITGLAFLTLGLFGLLFISLRAYAQPERADYQAPPSATTTTLARTIGATGASSSKAGGVAEGPFMGVADSAAPYDLRFIDEMTMHHQGAIMSSRMMISDSKHPELRDLARRIQEVQQQQIDKMQAWRKQWYPGASASAMTMDPMGGMMGSSNGGGMMGSADGGDMMSGGMMGNQDMVDRMFLRMMIPHHQLAVDMAQDALKNAQHAELKGLAQEIVSGQSAEITEMEGYLLNWYGEKSTRDVAGEMRDMMSRMMGR